MAPRVRRGTGSRRKILFECLLFTPGHGIPPRPRAVSPATACRHCRRQRQHRPCLCPRPPAMITCQSLECMRPPCRYFNIFFSSFKNLNWCCAVCPEVVQPASASPHRDDAVAQKKGPTDRSYGPVAGARRVKRSQQTRRPPRWSLWRGFPLWRWPSRPT